MHIKHVKKPICIKHSVLHSKNRRKKNKKWKSEENNNDYYHSLVVAYWLKIHGCALFISWGAQYTKKQQWKCFYFHLNQKYAHKKAKTRCYDDIIKMLTAQVHKFRLIDTRISRNDEKNK